MEVLEELYLDGQVRIRWDRLYLWFGAARLAKRSYRFIYKQWGEFCRERGLTPIPELLAAIGGDALVLRRGQLPTDPPWEKLADWT